MKIRTLEDYLKDNGVNDQTSWKRVAELTRQWELSNANQK